jgi:hypothetical protein
MIACVSLDFIVASHHECAQLMLEKEAVSKSKFQVSARPFPSWHRSTLTEIPLCHACSCRAILRPGTAGQEISVALGKEIEYHKRAVESLQDKQVLGCCHAHTLLGRSGCEPLGTAAQSQGRSRPCFGRLAVGGVCAQCTQPCAVSVAKHSCVVGCKAGCGGYGGAVRRSGHAGKAPPTHVLHLHDLGRATATMVEDEMERIVGESQPRPRFVS